MRPDISIFTDGRVNRAVFLTASFSQGLGGLLRPAIIRGVSRANARGRGRPRSLPSMFKF